MLILKALKSLLEFVQWRSVPMFAKAPLSARPIEAPPPRGHPSVPKHRSRAPSPVAPRQEPPQPDRARLRAAVLNVFNPSQPVESRVQLLGRRSELTQLLRVMMDLRAHAFVYGPRGAGKTSLMRA